MSSLAWCAKQVVMLVVVTMVVSVEAAERVTIPGHTQDTLLSLRWLLGRHYYPVGVAPPQDLADGLCLAHSALTLASSQPWSRTMWDASGKMADGVAAGATEARGHPDLCEGVRTHFPGALTSYLEHSHLQLALQNLSLAVFTPEVLQQQNTALRGQYCLVSIREEGEREDQGGTSGSWQLLRSLAGKFEHTYATCVPHTCTESFLQESLERQQQDPFAASLSVTCQHHDHDSAGGNFSFLLVTVVLVVLVTAATMLELQRPCSRTPAGCPCLPGTQLLHCFSLTQNWTRLMSYSTAETHLQTLDGIRVTSMVWVILAHRYMLFLISAANPRDILKHMNDWRYSLVFNAYPSVDTFLFVSGFLVSIFLKKRLGEFTFAGYCLQRYLRLVPAMGYVMWACTSLLPLLSSGPVWERTYHALFGRPCANTAWANLLFLNNFNDPSDMCLGHLWSLAVEWQLYLLPPLVLLPVYRWPAWRYRWLPLAASLALSVLLPAFITLLNDLPPTATHWDYEATRLYYNAYYVVPWCRAGPYLVGLAAGVLYHWLDDNNLILTQRCVRACGTVCWAAVVMVLVGPSWITGRGTHWAALYSSLARPAWAAALAFFVINAFKGQPGVAAWFFSRPVFAPLCRLSYCMFLVSLPLQTLAAARPHKIHYDHLTGAYLVLGDLCLSAVVSVVVLLLVEAPAARLLALVTSGKLWRRRSKVSGAAVALRLRKGEEDEEEAKEEETKPRARRHTLLLATLSSPALTHVTHRNL